MMLKKTLFGFLVTFVLLASYIFVGSIDFGTSGTSAFDRQMEKVSDKNNGYQAIAYLDDEQSINRDELLEKINEDEFNSEYFQYISEVFAKELEAAEQLSNYPVLQYPSNVDDPYDFPAFQHLITLVRFSILESRAALVSGDVDKAVVKAKQALRIAELSKYANHYLISYMIGLRAEFDVLSWMHRLAFDGRMDAEQVKELLGLVNGLARFESEDFSDVLVGEWQFAQGIQAQLFEPSLSERWEDYWSRDDSFAYYAFEDEESDWSGLVKYRLYNFLVMLFPKFYWHSSRVNQQVVSAYSKIAQASLLACNNIDIPHKEYDNFEVTWAMILLPNGEFKKNVGMEGVYVDYLQRRCAGFTFIEATRARLALRLYQLENNSFPVSLGSLVPEYIERIPKDYFDGNPLRYSAENEWLYSIGYNSTDDGGSLDALYVLPCAVGDVCMTNSTFTVMPENMVSKGGG